LADTPHFDLPFRFGPDGHPAEVEQDTVADIVNCVEAVLRTAPGDRVERPDFGSDPLVPDQQPLDLGGVVAQVEQFETRARMAAEQDPASVLQAAAVVNINITGEA
jgi:phage baseplate assembly protein W